MARIKKHKGGFVKPSKQEIDSIINEKRNEKIRTLFDYFKAWKTCQLNEQALKDMHAQIQTGNQVNDLDPVVDGFKMSKEAAQLRYELAVLQYKQMLIRTENLHQELIKVHELTDEDIQKEFNTLILGK